MAWNLFKSFFLKDDPKDSMTMTNMAVFDWTPLHSAAIATDKTSRKQKLETIVKLLRDPETNVNAKSSCGETPLHLACKTDFREAVSKFVNNPDIDVNAYDNRGKTPVMAAAEHGKREALWLMLRDPRVNLKLKSKEGKGLLDLLKDFDGDDGEFLECFEMIKKEIIKRSARTYIYCEDPQCTKQSRQGRNQAKIPSFNEAMSKLKGGPKIYINTGDIHGWHPLHYAALGLTEVDKTMLAKIPKFKETAPEKQGLGVITTLLENPRTIVNAKTNSGETALHVACRTNYGEAVSKLLTVVDIDVNITDNNRMTPVMAAAKHGKEKALGLMLMDPRVELDCRNIEGKGLEELLEDFGIGRDCIEWIQCSQMIRKARMKRRQWISQQNCDCPICVDEERKKRLKGKLGMETKTDTFDISHHMLEAARRSLECPICLDMMKLPTRIWMCQTSHLICEGCKDQLDGLWCPMCRVDKVTLRALFAEHIAETLF